MSWEQLRAIVQANAQEQAYWKSQPPRSCPNDGTPLQPGINGAEGLLHCPFDGYTWPE